MIQLKKPNVWILAVLALFLTACSDDDEGTTDDDGTATIETPEVNDYLLTATGQITLYDADGNILSNLSEGDDFYGQDATYLKGAVMSYTDNGDETITDNNTGLMWQQIPTSETFTWDEAEAYCESLELGGYTDWRMPSAKELFSISDFNTGWPYINQDYFSLVNNDEITKDEQYWSSNKYAGVTVEGGSNAAFGVNYGTGHIKAYSANATGPVGGKYVRAVRGDTYGTNNYTNNGDGTVTDSNTGLMWQQADDGNTYDWGSALTYAENSELAGYTDWRLPNIKEMQSIVDYDYSPTATDAAYVGPAIDPVFSCTQLPSEVQEAGYSDDYGYYWSGTSALFQGGGTFYYAWYVAFGRAVNTEGEDFHGAGAVRYDTKDENGPAGEDAERYYNYVRLVRDAN